MEINKKRFRLPLDEFFAEKVPKDLIMLHFTASTSASSVCHAWALRNNGKPLRVATPYVVDVDGTVYEFYPPECWAWHLGMTEANPLSINDKRSVGIEIVNPGPLRLDAKIKNQLNWWPNNFQTKYCSTEETSKYIKADFRGEKYFCTFPQVQMLAVQELVRKIEKDFSIPHVLPPEEKRFVYDPAFFRQYKGIASHQNYRADKSDIGPAFDWRWIQE